MKDYRFAFNQVFTFTGTDLVANKYERDVQQLPEVMLAEGDQALPIHHMSLKRKPQINVWLSGLL